MLRPILATLLLAKTSYYVSSLVVRSPHADPRSLVRLDSPRRASSVARFLRLPIPPFRRSRSRSLFPRPASRRFVRTPPRQMFQAPPAAEVRAPHLGDHLPHALRSARSLLGVLRRKLQCATSRIGPYRSGRDR